MSKQLSKAIKAIVKTATEIGELDIDSETVENVLMPLVNAAHGNLTAILEMGTTISDAAEDEDGDEDEDADEDEDGEDEDEDADEDGDEDEDGEDEDEDADEDEDGEDEDDFADEDEDEDADEDEDGEDEDEDEDEEEPAPKKKNTKKPVKAPAKVTKKPAAKPAAKGKLTKAKASGMAFAELRDALVAVDGKRASAIRKATDGVGGRSKAKTLVDFAAKKGWL